MDVIWFGGLAALAFTGLALVVFDPVSRLPQAEVDRALVGSLQGPARWLALLGLRFAPAMAAISRPSPSQVQQLALIGAPRGYDERAFVASRLVAGLLVMAVMMALLLLVGLSGPESLLISLIAGLLTYVQALPWLRGRVQREFDRAQRGFPALLDGMALALEAGQSFNLALSRAADRLDVRSGAAWVRAVRDSAADLRAGRDREETLSALELLLPVRVVQQFCAAGITADRAGLSLGPILRQQAGLARTLFHHEIERRAMQAPVKMLGPLLVCIFPCTFIVLLAPLLLRLQDAFL